MVAIKGRKSSNENPSILSHDFFLQNHADIVSCVAMVFVIGLMIQVTSAWAYIFVAVQHNVNVSLTEKNVQSSPKYTTGWKDGCAVCFYFIITIVLHAVIQKCLIDKISKRLYLSKSKQVKFIESSERLIFGYSLELADQSFDYASGNFNIQAVRYSVLSTAMFFQIHLLYKFVKQQLGIARKSQATVVTKLKFKQKTQSKDSKKLAVSNEEDSADDNKKNLRNGSTLKATSKAK